MSDSRSRLAWLDSLRGVAILGVVLVHCGQRPLSSALLAHVAAAGQYGVQLFFIISAITISMTYCQHVERYGATLNSALAWLTRRLFRIWPLYAIAALLYSVEHLILNGKMGAAGGASAYWPHILANLIFIHPWIPSANDVVPGGWSIGVEALFYGMFPILMVGRHKPHFPAALILLAAIFLATSELVSYSVYGTFAIANNSYLYFWPLTQLPVILVGCAFYFGFLNHDSVVPPMTAWIAGSLMVVLLIAGLKFGTWGNRSPGLAPSIIALAFCCLALLASIDRCGVIASRCLSQIGLCSYSIYLVHFAVIDVIRMALKELALNKVQAGMILLFLIFIAVTAISYFFATLSRRLIELPSIEIGRRLSLHLLPKRSP